jgi:hypothetical protein
MLRTMVEPLGEMHTVMSPYKVKQVIQDRHEIFPSLSVFIDEFSNIGREEKTCVY